MRRTYSVFFSVFCLVLIFGLVGCQSDGTAENAGQSIDKATESATQKIERTGDALASKAEEAGEYLSDAAITARVKAEILSDPLVNVTQIEVSTTNGIVKLSGTVDSQQSIDRAIAIARSFEGVKSVDSTLAY
ncbi:MAG: BON domain-containing protein [Desulfatiglandaceae bacterium]